MNNAYGIVIGVILLFPWSVVGIIVAGAVWRKIKAPGGTAMAVTTGSQGSVPR